jgi:hypothetical protein
MTATATTSVATLATPAVGGCFTVVIHGTIVGAEVPDADVLYCRSRLVRGREWAVVAMGAERVNTVDVVTQQAEKQPGPTARFTWNAPFEVVLQSTNPFGWPQLALALGTVDSSGKDRIAAYARCHVPMQPGSHALDLPLLAPAYSQPQHQFFGAFAVQPELRDPTFLCSTSDDRVVLTARPVPGHVRVTFNVMVSGLEELGYTM